VVGVDSVALAPSLVTALPVSAPEPVVGVEPCAVASPVPVVPVVPVPPIVAPAVPAGSSAQPAVTSATSQYAAPPHRRFATIEH
jgi:hypothetical protein